MKKLLVMLLCAAALVGCTAKVEDTQTEVAETEEVTAVEESEGIIVEKDEETGIRYFSFGHGEKTLVIVPGLSISYVTDSAQAVEASFAAFADNYTVYLFDVREEVPEGYTIEAMGEDLASVIKKLGLEKVHLYGCSMGGMESIYIAGTYPELVEKVTVVSSACEKNAMLEEVLGNWISCAEEGKLTELTTDMGQKIYSEAVYEANKEVFAGMADGLDEVALTRFIRSAKAIVDLDLTKQAAKITCSVLVVGAEGDHVLSAEASRKIAEITGGELVMYPEEYPHAVYDEAPEVKEKARAFFDAE
ncbi:MAG: alpha/beta hydrolase [Erysipelotrichaceae bacterium]|nr:alpha/beta hydrolase [Erysipelotrichaceae bacterium]